MRFIALQKIKPKMRRGASLIIGMILTVLILTFSLNMAQTVIKTKSNIRKALDAGVLDTGRQSIVSRAERLAQSGENPFDENLPLGEDYSFIATFDGQSIREDVWSSTGCPIPHKRVAQNNQYDYGYDGAFFTGENGLEAASMDRPFFFYDENQEVQQRTIEDRCFAGQAEQSDHFYVYPSPLVNRDNTDPVTVARNCDKRSLNSTIDGVEVNPTEHPCYWGKLEAGKTVTIPLNSFGRDTRDWDTLLMRVRPACPNNDEWCLQSERIEQIPIVPLNQNGLDVSPTVATWTLDVGNGEFLFGSTRGDVKGLEGNLGTDPCPNSNICRTRTFSEVTLRSLVGLANGLNLPSGIGLVRLLELGDDDGSEYFSFNKNQISEEILFKGITSFVNSNLLHNALIKLQITSTVNSRNQNLEYQIISDEKLFRFTGSN